MCVCVWTYETILDFFRLLPFFVYIKMRTIRFNAENVKLKSIT